MNRHLTLITFLKVFVPLSILLMVGLFLFDQYKQDELLNEIQVGSARGLRMEGGALSDGLRSHCANAVTMAELVKHELIDHRNDDQKHPHLPALFLNFLKSRPQYLRAQAFLAKPNEIVGARRRSPDSPAALVDKPGTAADLALYQRTLSRKSSRVTVISHFRPPAGRATQHSFTPFWRLAAIINSTEGEPQGMVVLDLTCPEQLAGIRSRSMSAGSTLYLIDMANGGILHSDAKRGWSALTPGATPADLGTKLPDVWARVLAQPEGQFQTNGGLFTFGTIEFGPPVGRAAKADDPPPHLLKVLIEVPAGNLHLPTPLFSPVLVIPVVFLLASLLWPWAVSRTRQRKAEQALHENEETVMAVSRSLRDAVIVVDEADRVKFWNPAAQVMFGYTRQEMMDQTVQILGTGEREKIKGSGTLGYYIRSLLNQNNDGLRRFTARHKDGSRFPVEVSVSTMYRDGRRFNVGILRDISQRVETERKLVELATTDPLTGLLNRRRFMELAREELARSERYGHHVSLLMLDLDRFKSVNDTHGHQLGDQVLCCLAEVVQHGLRQVDVMGRIGGEEFAVLMPETDVLQAVVAAERLRLAVEASSLKLEEGELKFTVSIGVAQAVPGDHIPLRTLFKQADDALYQAKETGRNRVQAA